MTYREQMQSMFSFLFNPRREEEAIHDEVQPIELGFPTFGTGEMNIDHMGQQAIPPTDNFNSHQFFTVKALPPIDVLRYEQVGYYGYIGGVKLYATSAAVIEIQVGEKTEKLLAMDYAGMVLAVRRVNQDRFEIVKLNLSDDIFVGYLGRGMKGRQTFSNYGDHLDAPWEKLEQFQFTTE